MSDKYEEWAQERIESKFGKCHNKDERAMVYRIALISGLAADYRWYAAKLEEEREQETCECLWSKQTASPNWDYCPQCARPMREYRLLPDSIMWVDGEMIAVNKQSVIAPTSAGGTTKSVAVTPDE